MRDKHAGRILYAQWYVVEHATNIGGWFINTGNHTSIGEFESKEIADHIVAIHNSWTGRMQ